MFYFDSVALVLKIEALIRIQKDQDNLGFVLQLRLSQLHRAEGQRLCFMYSSGGGVVQSLHKSF